MKKCFLGGFLIFSGICFSKYEKLETAITVFVFFCILTVAALQDIERMQISDGCCVAICAAAVPAMITMPEIPLEARLAGAVCVSAPMLVLTVLRRGAFGGGDIKLMAAGGFFLGWRITVIAALLAVFLGGLYCGYLLIVKKAERNSHFAFGPFLCMGMMLGTLFEQVIISLVG